MKRNMKNIIGLALAVIVIMALVVVVVKLGTSEKEEKAPDKRLALERKKRPVRAKKKLKSRLPVRYETREDGVPDEEGILAAIEAESEGDATISGVVVTTQGDPIEDATVAAEWHSWSRTGATQEVRLSNPPQATSDADGKFVIAGLRENDAYSLKASAEGYTETIKQQVPAQDKPVTITLAREASISGTVFREDTNQPLAGITVNLADAARKDRFDTKEVVSDYNGFYIIRGLLESEDYKLQAEGEGLISEVVRVKLKPEEEKTDVDLYLHLPPMITGMVAHKETGEPVGGVGLVIQKKYMGYSFKSPGSEESVAKTKSDSEGLFAFSVLPEGNYKLSTVFECLYHADKPLDVVVRYDLPLEPLVVKVMPTKMIHGIVTDEAGEPVEGARIYVGEAQGSKYKLMKYAKQVSIGITLPKFLAKSDAKGKYKVIGLPADVQKYLVCFDQDRYEVLEEPVEFEEGEMEKLLDVELSKGLSMSGWVTDSDSNPIADVVVKSNSRQAT